MAVAEGGAETEVDEIAGAASVSAGKKVQRQSGLPPEYERWTV
jgi:hypothetical protein